MYENLVKVLQEANELINHYNQLNQLVNTQIKEINELKAENTMLKEEAGSLQKNTRP